MKEQEGRIADVYDEGDDVSDPVAEAGAGAGAGAGDGVPDEVPKFALAQPLLMAAKNGGIPAMEKFFEDNPEVDVDILLDEEGSTALHYAASNEHGEAVKFLLNKGADLFLQRASSEPKTPFAMIKRTAGAIKDLIKDSVTLAIEGARIKLEVKFGRIGIHAENVGKPDSPGRMRVGVGFKKSQAVLPVLILKKELGQDYAPSTVGPRKCELLFGHPGPGKPGISAPNLRLNLPSTPLWVEDDEYEPGVLSLTPSE